MQYLLLFLEGIITFISPCLLQMFPKGAINYRIYSIPTTGFIDKDGYMVTGAQGMIDETMLRKGIEMIR